MLCMFIMHLHKHLVVYEFCNFTMGAEFSTLYIVHVSSASRIYGRGCDIPEFPTETALTSAEGEPYSSSS